MIRFSETVKKEQRFNEIYSENKNLIYKVCCFHFEDPDDRKDLFQEIITNVWRSLDKFEGKSKISTWIYRIAVNTCLAYIKKEKKEETKIAAYQNDADTFLADDITEKSLKQLHLAIQRLNKFDKALISLTLQGLSQKEIAEVLGLTENNVRVKTHRIKKELKTILKTASHGY